MDIDTTDPCAVTGAASSGACGAGLEGSLEALDRLPFGPSFFLGPLRAFVRERCPFPEEVLPRVTIHLVDGEAFDVCHVMGLSLTLVALAVYDSAQPFGTRTMATLLVPYESIARIAIRTGLPHDASLGFDASCRVVVLTEDVSQGHAAEELLRAAARAPGPVGDPPPAAPEASDSGPSRCCPADV